MVYYRQKSCYDHSEDNVRENVSGCVLGLIGFVLFGNLMCAPIVVSSSTKLCHGITTVLLTTDPTFYEIYHHFRITVKVFLYLTNFTLMFTFESTYIFHINA